MHEFLFFCVLQYIGIRVYVEKSLYFNTFMDVEW